MTPRSRRTAIIRAASVTVLVALTACSTRNTSAAPAATPVSRADSLIVSVEEVRRIANYEELTAHSHADLRQPPVGDLNAPGPCRAAGISDVTFGTGWSEFRSAGYHGITDDLKPGGPAMIQTVSQAVAVYPDSNAARGVLNQLEESLRACADLHDPHYQFTLDRPDSATVRLNANAWSHVYREKDSVLLSIGVVGLEPADQIAGAILQTATDRIR
ncbi:sensor domain-containing protein [Mycobacterium vicinigordonae]|uniref:Sensor domain-containing protein n=1 Tax=Mycobacterium vicinigordonae TaxID=1719132 RepID=A0A7D6I4Q7_9MYCO|nr:sensor domain-containing protein [Mycobacterium vicinigordonae]QLL06858.1 sensor domain-containing protein [Mycobacterium vicinigordonae]